jgi:hypothetical protein
MSLQITRRDIDRAMKTAESAARHAQKVKDKGESMMGHLTQTLEIGGAALASGVIKGRFGAVSLGPVPADLLAGVALHVLGFAGLAGKYDRDLHNFGDGVLAGYLVQLGAGFGTQWRIKSGLSPFATSGTQLSGGWHMAAGAIGAANAPLTEAELAAMAQAVR